MVNQPPRLLKALGTIRRPILAVVLGLMVLGGALTPFLFSQEAPHRAPSGTSAGDAPEGPANADLTAPLRRLVLGTVVVLVLAVGTLWGCSRWLKRGELPQGGQLEILARLTVDRRSQVFLVRAGGHRLLAAVDVNGLKALVPVSSALEEQEAAR